MIRNLESFTLFLDSAFLWISFILNWSFRYVGEDGRWTLQTDIIFTVNISFLVALASLANGLYWPCLDHVAIPDHITVARLDLHAHVYSCQDQGQQ